MNRDFLKEAIADAKTVKESAIANAKAALEEAFSPQLQAMFAQKLEEMDKDEVEEGYDEMDEAKEEVAEAKDSEKEMDESINEEDVDVDEEMDLDEILAELEKDEMSEGEEEIKEEEEVEAEETETEEEGEGSEDEDEEIDLEDMSEDDLKKFIEDVIADMVEAGELEAGEGMEGEEEGEEGDEEEMDIEMDMDAEETELAEGKKEEMKEGLFDFLKKKKAEAPVSKEDSNPIVGVDWDGNYIRKDGTFAEAKEELDEALETIAILKSELNEINLLNAKLLYSNKIFKSKNMTESQKAKVLGAFDKANTVAEVKVVFETINENFTPAKKTVNEGVIGSASKATGLVKEAKQPIVESDEMVNRFKKLAGII